MIDAMMAFLLLLIYISRRSLMRHLFTLGLHRVINIIHYTLRVYVRFSKTHSHEAAPRFPSALPLNDLIVLALFLPAQSQPFRSQIYILRRYDIYRFHYDELYAAVKIVFAYIRRAAAVFFFESAFLCHH